MTDETTNGPHEAFAGSILILFIVASTVTAARGDQWTSPDGVIVVTAPDVTGVRRIATPPEPFIALWSSQDQRLRFGVLKSGLPSNVRLIRSSTEEGLAEKLGGTITASSIAVNNGHEIWIMTAKGSAQGMPGQITQAIVRYDGSMYKVMVAAVGDQSTNDKGINAFVNSLEITSPNLKGGSGPLGKNDQRRNDKNDLHTISKDSRWYRRAAADRPTRLVRCESQGTETVTSQAS